MTIFSNIPIFFKFVSKEFPQNVTGCIKVRKCDMINRYLRSQINFILLIPMSNFYRLQMHRLFVIFVDAKKTSFWNLGTK